MDCFIVGRVIVSLMSAVQQAASAATSTLNSESLSGLKCSEGKFVLGSPSAHQSFQVAGMERPDAGCAFDEQCQVVRLRSLVAVIP